MTLGVTGVVWLPRTATGNSTTLLAGAGAAPVATAAAAWGSIAAAYSEAAITVGRVMAVLAAGWEGEAANAAQARLGSFLAWTQSTAAKAAHVGALATSEAAAYTAAALTMPNPLEIAAVQTAKVAAYSSGGALNGSAQAAELADRALDVRAALVMEAYEAATTPLAVDVSFDRPPEIVNDGGNARSGSPIADAHSYEESGIFGFGARTSPAQAAAAAIGAALQNPGFAGAASQAAGTAGSVVGSSVSTVASAATHIGGTAASSLMSSMGSGQNSAPASFKAEPAPSGGVSTRAVSAGSMAGGSMAGGSMTGGSMTGGGAVGAGSLGGLSAGAGKLGGQLGSSGLGAGAGGERGLAGGGASIGGGADGGAATRGTPGGAPTGGSQAGQDDEEHETPGYLKQFEHFSDGRTVAPSVIGADPTWIDR